MTDFGTGTVTFAAPATGPVTIVFYAATADMAAAVTGFSTPSSSSVKVVAVRDLSGEVAALTAQLAAANAAKATAETALAAEKTASAAALAAEKAASAKALADAKAASDAEIAKLKADNAAALAAMKKAFNTLAAKWNAKFPKAKVATLK